MCCFCPTYKLFHLWDPHTKANFFWFETFFFTSVMPSSTLWQGHLQHLLCEVESLNHIHCLATVPGVSFWIFLTERCEGWSLGPQDIHVQASRTHSHTGRSGTFTRRADAAAGMRMQPASRLRAWGGLQVTQSDSEVSAGRCPDVWRAGQLDCLPDVAGGTRTPDVAAGPSC